MHQLHKSDEISYVQKGRGKNPNQLSLSQVTLIHFFSFLRSIDHKLTANTKLKKRKKDQQLIGKASSQLPNPIPNFKKIKKKERERERDQNLIP